MNHEGQEPRFMKAAHENAAASDLVSHRKAAAVSLLWRPPFCD